MTSSDAPEHAAHGHHEYAAVLQSQRPSGRDAMVLRQHHTAPPHDRDAMQWCSAAAGCLAEESVRGRINATFVRFIGRELLRRQYAWHAVAPMLLDRVAGAHAYGERQLAGALLIPFVVDAPESALHLSLTGIITRASAEMRLSIRWAEQFFGHGSISDTILSATAVALSFSPSKVMDLQVAALHHAEHWTCSPVYELARRAARVTLKDRHRHPSEWVMLPGVRALQLETDPQRWLDRWRLTCALAARAGIVGLEQATAAQAARLRYADVAPLALSRSSVVRRRFLEWVGSPAAAAIDLFPADADHVGDTAPRVFRTRRMRRG